MSKHKDVDVVTIGESMILFQPSPEGTISYAPFFTSSVGGAESNLVTALSRLGLKTRWISHLGQDPFAKLVISALSGEGVDVSEVKQVGNAPTAVFFKESKGYGDPNVYYYRKHSAASQMTKDDIKDSWFNGARHLHVTGITPAIGEGTTEMIRSAMIQAREQGLTISFDPNLRRKLWDEETARKTLLSLIPLCDIFLPGIDEAEFLVGDGMKTEEYTQFFREMGPTVVVLKLGTEGSYTQYLNDFIEEPVYKIDQVIDTVGAGDAFAAGLLSVLLSESNPLEEASLKSTVPTAVKRANLLGALATQFKGDWEGNPTLDEVNHIIEGKQSTTR
ncbi:sugar kinase [Salipaludibacillus sp. HK11]|uniref:sugar kinase n=1 Tax=Salipaludibacillus sp. HK11 TaxID=3394320 RepID=UPI0039FDC0EC